MKNYDKPAISIQQQIVLLKERGLIIHNQELAEHYLSNISYYRLRAYTYPFQYKENQHKFKLPVTFEQIIELYKFDRKLRLLLLDGLEKIEISFRTQIIHQWAIDHGSHWFIKPDLYESRYKDGISIYENLLESLEKEISRSKETFIKHYQDNYTEPFLPPSWMSLEITSFGLLSQIFSCLKDGKEKKMVRDYYGLKSSEILNNWIYAFSYIRNICAHHSRLWNRKILTLKIPRKTAFNFINNKGGLHRDKLYLTLCAMVYMINIIDPQSNFKLSLIDMIKNNRISKLDVTIGMGFPKNWLNELFWKI